MKNSNQNLFRKSLLLTVLFTISLFTISCNEEKAKKEKAPIKEEIAKFKEILWNINAIDPEGKNLTIKAIGEDGKMYDVNAIQNSDQDSFLDIEAFINGKKLPVKVLVSDDKYAPVKAIDKGGISYDIKAITSEGEELDVKGILRFGNVISLKAINKKGAFYEIKSTSPSGKLNDVKGIKINHKEKEMTLNGFNIMAHVKSMHQSNNEFEAVAFKKLEKKSNLKKKSKKKSKGKSISDFKNIIWTIKAITLDGKNLDVKVIDSLGNKFEIKAIQDSEQHSFLNIKAIVNNDELPIKVLVSEDGYSPVKAISRDGSLYDIKAIADDGSIIDIKGIKRLGNIISIKAVTENGEFYAVKALSPDGTLNAVKGIKIFDRPTEMKMRGNKVYAHLKAITQ